MNFAKFLRTSFLQNTSGWLFLCEETFCFNGLVHIFFWWKCFHWYFTKMKFSIKDFFSKCDQVRSFLRIWSHLLKKSLMETFILFVECGVKNCLIIDALHFKFYMAMEATFSFHFKTFNKKSDSTLLANICWKTLQQRLCVLIYLNDARMQFFLIRNFPYMEWKW